MTHTRFAFIKANWHSDIVDQALVGFRQQMDAPIDVFDVPGVFEIPLKAKRLALSDRYTGIVCAGFVVDGGIYRHDFVSSAVINGIMQVQLETDVPVLSVILTPHNYQETEDQTAFFRSHCVKKGEEAAAAARSLIAAPLVA